MMRSFKNIMKFHLLCGYKRSGKDTFYKKLYEGNFNNYNKDYSEKCVESVPHFYILSKPGCIDLTLTSTNPFRLPMADMVKQEVNQYLKIGFKTKEMEEMSKDSLLIYDDEKCKYRVLREYYIEHAMKMREINPDHWCNQAYIHMLTSEEGHDEVAITDWRFKNERDFFVAHGSCVTYRIFRSETDDENFFDLSEHSLDEELTDFLVVGSIKDIERAKLKFPQYNSYQICYFT